MINNYINQLKNTERIERKVVGHKGSFWIFKKELYKNSFCKNYSTRKISSIYFDTSNFDFAYDNLNGESKRLKIRIRFYNNQHKYYLEYKFKDNFLGYKKTTKLRSTSILLAIKESIKKIFYDFYFKANPTCLISYTRDYLINNKIRATIDKNLTYSLIQTKDLTNYKFNPSRNMPFDIMEFKYKPAYDNLFRNKFFPESNDTYLRSMKSSKYITALLLS